MDESSYYIWQPAGLRRAVYISFDVIDRILQDVLRGFGAVPKRGAEVGGILTGKVAGDIIEVDGFEPVPCEHRLGPSYLLTENDQRKFDEVRTRLGDAAIGYYRSDTRKVMSLTPEDLGLMDRHFSEPSNVALLIKPYATKVSAAGFFLRQDGKFPPASPQLFPFSRKLLGGGDRPRTPVPPIAAPEAEIPPFQSAAYEAAAPAVALQSQPPAPHQESFERVPFAKPEAAVLPRRDYSSQLQQTSHSKGFWAAALSLAIALGWGGGYFTARNLSGPADPGAYRLALAAIGRPNDVAITWDRNSAPIRTAVRGHLIIREGSGEKRIPLDLDQLRLGRVIYRSSVTTTFDLEIEQIAGSVVRESTSFTPLQRPLPVSGNPLRQRPGSPSTSDESAQPQP